MLIIPVLLAVFFAVQLEGNTHQGILRPAGVPVEEAIAEGEAAAGKPGTPLSRWRHVVTAPPDRPAVREVTVVTPYYRVAREAYLRAIRGEKLTAMQASALLERVVKDYGPFPIGLLLVISPAPPRLPHPQTVDLKDASGKRLPVTGFVLPGGAESVEFITDATGADLRWIELMVPVDPSAPQRIRINLRGVK